MKDQLKFIKESDWNEVFQGWQKREGKDEGWIHCATQIKGWPDWESWRQFSADQFDAKNRKWEIYEIQNPNELIPSFLIGPTPTWQKMVENLENKTFRDLVNERDMNQSKKISSIINNFPQQTQLIGLYLTSSNQIMCFEGHHRSTAIAVSNLNQSPIQFEQNPTIALTHFSKEDELLIQQMIQRGSTFNP